MLVVGLAVSSLSCADHDSFSLVWIHRQAFEIKPLLSSVETVRQCRGRRSVVECSVNLRVTGVPASG